ncbi:hypothetical protein TRFO_24645 [Tritrichomonas foetus]|uniref:Legume-like lectin family protein n=1 Tax=Tritrichomonas foetus TaxID=1144522 RepID=A0A1J4K8E5_9EUKA|nr:hypothetical protein TRFO_24645 [Tritrichomonas foetus]|eukprot:OHT07242.1 hypothetical protein TRFO_24645 [Tritrichomonas foetus]
MMNNFLRDNCIQNFCSKGQIIFMKITLFKIIKFHNKSHINIEKVKINYFMLFSIISVFSFIALDLVPPFKAFGKRNRVKYWTISGDSSKVTNDSLILIEPNFDLGPGSAWSNLPPPSGDFQCQFSLKITNRSMKSIKGERGGFSALLIPNFGTVGGFHGGPKKFKGGVTISFHFIDDNTLNLQIFEDELKNESALNEIPKPTKKTNVVPEAHLVRLDDNEIFNFTFIYKDDDDLLTVFVDENETTRKARNSDNLFKKKKLENVSRVVVLNKTLLSMNVDKVWLGFTADLVGIEILNITYQLQNNNENSKIVTRIGSRPFRNPIFKTSRDEVYQRIVAKIDKKMTPENKKGKNHRTLFRVIDEISDVLTDVSTYLEINSFLRKILIPFSLKWHRRTFKQVEAASKISKTISTSINESNEWIEFFNSTVMEFLEETVQEIQNFSQNLKELGCGPAWINTDEIESEIKSLEWINVMKIFVSAEAAVAALFVVYRMIFPPQRKLSDSKNKKPEKVKPSEFSKQKKEERSSKKEEKSPKKEEKSPKKEERSPKKDSKHHTSNSDKKSPSKPDSPTKKTKSPKSSPKKTEGSPK